MRQVLRRPLIEMFPIPAGVSHIPKTPFFRSWACGPVRLAVALLLNLNQALAAESLLFSRLALLRVPR